MLDLINRLPPEQRAEPIEPLFYRINHIEPKHDRLEALNQVCDALANRVANVRTLDGLRRFLGIMHMPPLKQQARLIELLSQRVDHIEPKRDRIEAMDQVCRALLRIQKDVDCSAIVKHLPRVVESLIREHKEPGYSLVWAVFFTGRRFGMDDENQSATLLGLARILPQVPELNGRTRHAQEVVGIFEVLEELPMQLRMDTIKSLCEERFHLLRDDRPGVPDAADVVTDRALAAARGECTPDQRIAITNALIDGLHRLPHPNQRFDGEFDKLYQASRNQESRTRTNMLTVLSGFLDHLSPDAAEKMRGTIHSELVELEKTNPSDMDRSSNG
ncbi:hypothetical protein LJR230_004902 [Trinickia sp. LjRoot230]|uniref:hypothetical protein n=1 Tax=Trinickia sp. LjRoot230 TaxID=3342288 RepID=UPI003ECD3D0A